MLFSAFHENVNCQLPNELLQHAHLQLHLHLRTIKDCKFAVPCLGAHCKLYAVEPGHRVKELVAAADLRPVHLRHDRGDGCLTSFVPVKDNSHIIPRVDRVWAQLSETTG
jgi:hypothetical protein